jgi:phenylalanyl-tRNA synthetase alpha chain
MREVDSTGTLKTGEKALAALRKRKLIGQKWVFIVSVESIMPDQFIRKGQWFSVEKGPSFSISLEKPETDLTADMIASYAQIYFGTQLGMITHFLSCRGSWKTATFKKYNFEAAGVPTNGGAFHPLLKVREEFRNIFLEMG